MTRDEAWEAYVRDFEIEVPEERVEEELELIIMDMKHRMQYAALTGEGYHPFPQMEIEQQQEELRQTAYNEVKSELVMAKLLREHEFAVTREELEAEGAALAERQGTTIEQVKSFLGPDLALLERDLREAKAMDWVLEQTLQQA